MKKYGEIVVVLFLFLIYGCSKEMPHQEIVKNSSFTVEDAQKWFEMLQGNVELKSGFVGEKQKIRVAPEWCNGIPSQNDDVEVVEVPLKTLGRFGFADSDSWNDYLTSGNLAVINSLTRIVIMRNRKTGNIDEFYMTIQGSYDKIKKREINLDDIKYLKRSEKFSGLIYYHNLCGDFVNGWGYEEGKLTKVIKLMNVTRSLPTTLKDAAICYTSSVTQWWQDCKEWYQWTNLDPTPVYIRTDCNGPIYAENTLINNCFYAANGLSGSGTGGGGYSPPAPPTDPNKPCGGDPIKGAQIASSGASGQHGGLFGCTRTGGTSCTQGNYDKWHGGIDIYAAENSDLYSISSGQVTRVGYDSDLGEFIEVITYDGIKIMYGHLNSVSLSVNDVVFTGTKLGLTGRTGNAQYVPNPHVHIQIKVNGTYVDPQPYISTKFNADGTVLYQCGAQPV